MQVIVVDAANVVGSRPDGWWRDRPAAAQRLHAQLVAAHWPHDEVVVVLEGAARRGPAEGTDHGVRTVHAPGSGDDAIVDEVRRHAAQGHEVVAVTADRELRARVEAAGGRCRGPGWLLDRL